MLFEVRVDSLESALAAQEGACHRLELCSALESEGLTPSPGLWTAVRARVALPIMVMIRARGGGFCYDPLEIETMLLDMQYFLAQGAHGVVLGALRKDGTVDQATVARFVEAAGGHSVTFHRAFDCTPDPRRALEELRALGIDRVLTSGQSATLDEGLALLRELTLQGRERIAIMPGGGIHEQNAGRVASFTGATELHFSASVSRPGDPAHCQLRECASPPVRKVTSAERVRAIIAAAEAGARPPS